MRTPIEKLHNVIEMLRTSVVHDWQLQQVQIFIKIAMSGDEGITQPEIAEQIKMQQAPVSRNCRALSKEVKTVDGKKEIIGHDLVYMQPDWENRRCYRVWCTPKGNALKEKIVAILGD